MKTKQSARRHEGAADSRLHLMALAAVEGMPDQTFYHLKRHAIQHSLYGVDFDPGAVEIAKLRLKTALTPFVTGTHAVPGEQLEYDNQGLGLSVTDQIAKRCKGELYLWTGRALYRSQSGEVETMPVAWPGTVVFQSLPIKLAINVTDVVKEFDAVLKKPKIQLKFDK